MADPNSRSSRLVTATALGSYVTVFQPRAFKDGDEPKYSISLLWDKDDPFVAKLQERIEEVAAVKFGPTAPALMEKGKLKNPLRDGDTDRPDDPVYAGKMFLNATSKRQPGIVDAHLQPVIDEAEAFSGCFFRASISLFAFDTKGNKGVAAGLNNVQVVKKGERIDGGRSAEEEFSEVEETPKAKGKPAPAKAPAKKAPAKAAPVEDDEDMSDIE